MRTVTAGQQRDNFILACGHRRYRGDRCHVNTWTLQRAGTGSVQILLVFCQPLSRVPTAGGPGPAQVNIGNNKICIHCKKHYPCRFWQMFDWLLFEIHDGSRWYCLIKRLSQSEKLQEKDKNQCPNMSLEFHYVHTMGVKCPLDRTLWSS